MATNKPTITLEDAKRMILDARRGLRTFKSVECFLSDDRYNVTEVARIYIECALN